MGVSHDLLIAYFPSPLHSFSDAYVNKLERIGL